VGVPKSVVGAAAAVGGGVLVVGLTGAVLSGQHSNATTLTAATVAAVTPGQLPHATLNLSAYPDSMGGEHGSSGGAHPDWVSYGPSTNLHAPAHTLLTVTIKQYDSGGPITNPYFAQARGTLGGTMTVDGKTVKSVDPEAVGHTFTIHSAPTNQDPLFVSVPLPAVPDDAPNAPGSDYAQPHVVTFSFVTGGPGKYVWNCEYPCGDGYYASFGGLMATGGYMSGTFTVA